MGVPERRSRAKAELRGRILAAAEELFVREGYQNVSMRKIADRIEYSPTVIYHHFKSKGELLYCLLEPYQARLLAIMEEILNRGDDPVSTLRNGMRAYTDFGLANPSFYTLSFMSPPLHAPEDYLVEGQTGTRLFRTLRDSAERCMRQGHFSPTDLDLATQILWCANHGVTSLLLSNPNFPWVDRQRLIDQSIECAIRGLSARRAEQ
jgi:AcrR family transcriptional regulator